MTDTATAPATPAQTITRPDGLPVTPAAFYESAAVSARAEVDKLKGDAAFYKQLVAERTSGVSGEATKRWGDLHRAGWPAPAAIQTVADVSRQAAATNDQRMTEYIGSLRQRGLNIDAAQEAELRGGVVNFATRQWAEEEKGRLIRDAGWRAKFFANDRAAVRDWNIVVAILGMKPVPHLTLQTAGR